MIQQFCLRQVCRIRSLNTSVSPFLSMLLAAEASCCAAKGSDHRLVALLLVRHLLKSDLPLPLYPPLPLQDIFYDLEKYHSCSELCWGPRIQKQMNISRLDKAVLTAGTAGLSYKTAQTVSPIKYPNFPLATTKITEWRRKLTDSFND